MGLKTNSLLVLVLVYGTHGQFDDFATEAIVYGITTQDPIVTDCTVSNQDGACVESRAFCRTPHNTVDDSDWRAADPCDPGVCCLKNDVIRSSTSNVPGSSSIPSTDSTTTQGPRTSKASVGCGLQDEFFFRAGDTGVVHAKFGEFPWTVAIFRIKRRKESYWCVGSLIHPRVVLSVANRFDRRGKFKVRAGDLKLSDEQEILPRQDRDVESSVIHEDFDGGNGRNDIALLFLNADIIQDRHINYACLPVPNFVTQPSVTCYTSGWGRLTKNGPLQDTQKMVEMPIVDRNSCLTQLRQGLRNEKYELHSSMMCAGGAGQDVCKGDGGGPLVCPYTNVDDRFYQAGIVSWGIDCQTQPGVYSDVAVHREWIDRKVKEKGYTTNYYTP